MTAACYWHSTRSTFSASLSGSQEPSFWESGEPVGSPSLFARPPRLAAPACPSGYRSELTIWRYASSGNAFSDVVRTLPSLPSISVKRAATASSGAS